MNTNQIKNDSESLQVIKNIDFLLRTKGPKTILVTSDYPEEGHGEFAQELVSDLTKIYGRKSFVLDLRSEAKQTTPGIEYQNIKDLDYVESNIDQLKIYLDELSRHNDQIFIIHNVNKNIQTSTLPEISIDSALITRSDKSVGIKKSRYITNLINDADLPILGLVEYRA